MAEALARRSFLHLCALAGGAVAVAACSQPAPAPTAPPAAAPTRSAAPPATSAPVVAPQATAAPAAATAAPAIAAAPTKAPAAATAAPAQASAATTTPEGKIGKALIGKLEGPEIITDPARWPKTFKEAPALAELVKAGKLPPVQERIGQDPLVLKPVQEIGKYGGNWRSCFTGPSDFLSGIRNGAGDGSLFLDYSGNHTVVSIARGWKQSDDGRTLDINLRRGMRWSDGAPFTADDYVFWYQDVYTNKDLFPIPILQMAVNDKPVSIAKVDTYTVRFNCPDPYYMLPYIMASGNNGLSGQAKQGRSGGGGYMPAHYLKQFHPKYTSMDELEKKVKEAKFDNWKNLFLFKAAWDKNPDLPVVTPWKTVNPITQPVWSLERNPYSIWVDTEGNQLPYMDRLVMTMAENIEIVNLRAIAGEYDFQNRNIDLAKLPVFLENQQRGNYKVYLDPAPYGGDMTIRFNLTYEADPELGKWFNNLDFRRALSLGVDRDQLNETFWLGTGTPTTVAPEDANPYFPGPEYRTMWATYEPAKANEMLDKLGLNKKDADGYRLRTDGKGRLSMELQCISGQFLPFARAGEMIREQWKKIGIELRVVEIDMSLASKRNQNNEQHLSVWNLDGAERTFGAIPRGVGGQATIGSEYARWFISGGAQGKVPPPRLKEAMEKYKKWFSVPEAEGIPLGKEIWKICIEEAWVISTCMGAASGGVRVAKVNMGNVPARQYNSTEGSTPSCSRPQTFFYK